MLLQSLGPTDLHLLSPARIFSGPLSRAASAALSLPSGPRAVEPVRAGRNSGSPAPAWRALRGRGAAHVPPHEHHQLSMPGALVLQPGDFRILAGHDGCEDRAWNPPRGPAAEASSAWRKPSGRARTARTRQVRGRGGRTGPASMPGWPERFSEINVKRRIGELRLEAAEQAKASLQVLIPALEERARAAMAAGRIREAVSIVSRLAGIAAEVNGSVVPPP